MIVQCSNCQTKFRLDATKVGSRRVKARCSRCGSVFQVDGPGGEGDPSIAPAQPVAPSFFSGPLDHSPAIRGSIASDLQLEGNGPRSLPDRLAPVLASGGGRSSGFDLSPAPPRPAPVADLFSDVAPVAHPGQLAADLFGGLFSLPAAAPPPVVVDDPFANVFNPHPGVLETERRVREELASGLSAPLIQETRPPLPGPPPPPPRTDIYPPLAPGASMHVPEATSPRDGPLPAFPPFGDQFRPSPPPSPAQPPAALPVPAPVVVAPEVVAAPRPSALEQQALEDLGLGAGFVIREAPVPPPAEPLAETPRAVAAISPLEEEAAPPASEDPSATAEGDEPTLAAGVELQRGLLGRAGTPRVRGASNDSRTRVAPLSEPPPAAIPHAPVRTALFFIALAALLALGFQLHWVRGSPLLGWVGVPAGPSLDGGLTGVGAQEMRAIRYPGAEGPLLVVTGRAINTSGRSLSDLEVVARLVDDERVVVERSAWVGSWVPTDRLATISTVADADAAAQRAKPEGPLLPGKTRPFMVVIPSPPAGGARFAVRVVFKARSGGGQARAGAGT